MEMMRLFLVHLTGFAHALEDIGESVELGEGLYVIKVEATRSKVYHAVKKRCAPKSLLVAQLDDVPKLMGFKPGATKALRLLAAVD
jgi:hypothetical protein